MNEESRFTVFDSRFDVLFRDVFSELALDQSGGVKFPATVESRSSVNPGPDRADTKKGDISMSAIFDLGTWECNVTARFPSSHKVQDIQCWNEAHTDIKIVHHARLIVRPGRCPYVLLPTAV